jgi:hypothetical protein
LALPGKQQGQKPRIKGNIHCGSGYLLDAALKGGIVQLPDSPRAAAIDFRN